MKYSMTGKWAVLGLVVFSLCGFGQSEWSRSQWPKVSAGEGHTCAVSENGQVKCWGYNSVGQLGLGDKKNRGEKAEDMGDLLPVVELGVGNKAVQISAGDLHTCALFENGKIKCWGSNGSGELGLGDGEIRGDEEGEMGDSLPFVNLGAEMKAVQISAGGFHTCALLEKGQVKCWGHNDFGQLGLEDRKTRGVEVEEMGDLLPIVDLGAGNKAVQISAGRYQTCALLEKGQVKCWGRNSWGQLGLGDMKDRGDEAREMGDFLSIVKLGVGNKAVQLSGGSMHNCALLENGRIKCWGGNHAGQLGLEDRENRGDVVKEMGDLLPAVDLGAGSKAVQISAGEDHTCALLENGQVKCWGHNHRGQLGLGDWKSPGAEAGDMGEALPFILLEFPVRSLELGASHSCVVLINSGVKCWGEGVYGSLGQGNSESFGDDLGEVGLALDYIDIGIGF